MTKNIKKILCLTLATACFLASFGASSTNVSAKKKKSFGTEYYFINDRYNLATCLYYSKDTPNNLKVKLGDYICLGFNDYTCDHMNKGYYLEKYVKTSDKKIAEYKYIKKYKGYLIKTKKLGTTKITVTAKWGYGRIKRSKTYKIKVVPRITAKESDVSPELKEIAKDVVKGTKLKVMFTDDFSKDKYDAEESIVYLTSECKNDLTCFGIKKEEASIDARIKHTLYEYIIGPRGTGGDMNLHVEYDYEKTSLAIKNMKGFKIDLKRWRWCVEYKSSDDLDYFDKVDKYRY